MSDDIDLYSDDLEAAPKKDQTASEEADLYNDVLTSSNAEATPVSNEQVKSEPPDAVATNTSSFSTSSYKFGSHGGSWVRRVSLYIGNLTWWTTDQDLMDIIRELGVMDLLEIKFNENRVNGQSKGFCMAHLGSDSSAQLLLEKLPKHKIHGQTPLVTPCNKQNLMHFEQKKTSSVSSSETVATTIQNHNAVGAVNMAAASMSFVPPMFPPMPPTSTMVIPPRMPPMMPSVDIKTSVASAGGFPGMPPFFPPGMPPMPPFPGMMPPFLPPTGGAANSGMSSPKEEKRPETPPLTDTEIEEIMSRNRQVSTTAIARALADASKGEYEDASQTLKLAIKLIKQSKVSDDSRCQVLITSLEQCLRGITQKFSVDGGGSGSGSSKSHSSRRKRTSREGSSERGGRERDVSRSERHRERSGDYYSSKRSRSRDRSTREDKYERRESKRDREYRR